jgi:hypothetical protein
MITLLRQRGFEAGYGLMLLGLAVLLSGFGLDAWLHIRDSTLAEREGIFTLSNPRHLMVAIGVVVAVLGGCLGPYSRYVLGRRSTLLTAAVPVAALVIAASVSGMFATALNDLSHHDAAAHNDAAASAHTATTPDTSHAHAANILSSNAATIAVEESTMHEPANTQGVTAENLAFADQFLADARAGTEKYKDVAVAEADGYLRITPDLPLIGAHFYKSGRSGLVPGLPSILLYESDGNGGWELTGLAYTLAKTPGDDTPPVTKLGGLAHWHYHTNLCFTAGGNVTIAVSAAQCHGVFQAETDWLLHVWVWKDSPEGVFAHANSLMQ